MVSKKRTKRRTELRQKLETLFIPTQQIIKGLNKRANTTITQDPMQKKFDDLYPLLYREELLIQAYGNIQRNKGSLTPGTDKQTIDSITLNQIV